VLETLRAVGPDPEALAGRLIRGNNAAVTIVNPACANKTGNEHCAECVMPAVQTLVDELVSVKAKLWQNQETMAAKANRVCDKEAPANRFGGAAKCCSASSTASEYEPAGYDQCESNTFSRADPATQTVKFTFNPTKGYYYDGGAPSTMIGDCCSGTSQCHANDNAIIASMKSSETLLNALYIDVRATQQKLDALTKGVTLEGTKIRNYRSEVIKICSLSSEATHDADGYKLGVYGADDIAWPTTKAEAETGATACTSGQIKDVLVRQDTLNDDADSFRGTITVTERVIEWLNTEGAALPEASLHTAAPTALDAVTTAPAATETGFHTMISLLEGAAKSCTNVEGKQALAKVIQLMEGAQRGTTTRIVERLSEILDGMQLFKAQIETIRATYQTLADAEVATLLSQIAKHKSGRDAAMLDKVRLQGTAVGLTHEVAHQATEIANQEAGWVHKYQQREINSHKCTEFMLVRLANHTHPFTSATNTLLPAAV
jgi:hypothetical protein